MHIYSTGIICLALYLICNIYNFMWLVLPNVGKLSKALQNYKGNHNSVYYKNRDLRLLLDLLWDEKSNLFYFRTLSFSIIHLIFLLLPGKKSNSFQHNDLILIIPTQCHQWIPTCPQASLSF